ncbi:MAG: DUF1223 domain-containing protein [Salibacteraceae bacterium]
MNYWMIMISWIGLLACGSQAQEMQSEPVAVTTGSLEAVAVVELFTSEGCSSCPPAEAVLNQLVATLETSDQRIFPLAFHVDYWNRLGWTDRFSKADFSQRQYQYAEKFGGGRVYTPQMIVNGKKEFVGSNQRTLDAALKTSLSQPASVGILANCQQLSSGELQVGYGLTNHQSGQILNIALVQQDLETEVARGENRGRKLAHQNVVRHFQSIPLKAETKGEVKLSLTEEELGNCEVILYVQDQKNWEVLGAVRWIPAT